MGNNKINIENILLDLYDGMDRLMSVSTNRKKFWCWEYYREREGDFEGRKEKKKIYNQIHHLERFGYVNSRGLTIKGLIRIVKIRGIKKINRERWDGKWRIVIFDIPEKRKKLREYFRRSLGEMGFEKLQNSVWISPFDSFEEIQELIKLHGLAKYVVFIESSKISNDLLFKKIFKI